MAKPCMCILAAFVLTLTLAANAESKLPAGPETVEVRNGSVTLHALLWRPQGRGPFPAILLNHGSGRTREELERLGPYEKQADYYGAVYQGGATTGGSDVPAQSGSASPEEAAW